MSGAFFSIRLKLLHQYGLSYSQFMILIAAYFFQHRLKKSGMKINQVGQRAYLLLGGSSS